MSYDYIWVFYLLWIVLETGLEMAGCQCPKADCNLEIAGKNKTGLPNLERKKCQQNSIEKLTHNRNS